MDVENDESQSKTYLFTLRVWAVGNGSAAPQWRSRLQDIQSGEVNYFKDLEALHNFINERLHEENPKSLCSQQG